MKSPLCLVTCAWLVTLVTLVTMEAVPPPKVLKEVLKQGAAAVRISRSNLYNALLPAPHYKVSPQYAQQLQEQYAQQLSLGGNGVGHHSATNSLRQLNAPQPYATLLGEVSLQSPKAVVLDATEGASHGPSPHYSPDYSQAAYRALKAAYAGRTAAATAALAAHAASVASAATANDDAAEHSPALAYAAPAAPTAHTANTAHAAVQHAAATSHSYRDEEHGGDDHYATKYQFGYQVRDPKHGSYFGHSEARDGHITKGQYHVLLPDGRLQNVQYYSDLSGFHAQVSYNGVAKHTDTHALAAHAV